MFEYIFFGFAHRATHVQARESEGTACVVVVSGSRFESFFYFYFLHVRARTSITNFQKKIFVSVVKG